MNLKKLIIVSVLSFVCGLFGCESQNKVSFSDYKSGDRTDTQVVFEEGEITLGEQFLIKNNSKLRSKTTTVFTSDIYFYSDKTVDGKGVVFCFRKVKSIPQSLKSLAEKKPFIKETEQELKQRLTSIKSVVGYSFTPIINSQNSDLQNKIVFQTKL